MTLRARFRDFDATSSPHDPSTYPPAFSVLVGYLALGELIGWLDLDGAVVIRRLRPTSPHREATLESAAYMARAGATAGGPGRRAYRLRRRRYAGRGADCFVNGLA